MYLPPRRILPKKILFKCRIISSFNRSPGTCNHIQVKTDIVDRGQSCRENLIGIEQVVQVGTGEIATAIAITGGINWEEVSAEIAVGQSDLATLGEESGTAGVTGRDDAVKHIHPPFN